MLTVRRTQTAPRQPAAFEFVDARTIRLAQGAAPEPGSIYELRYHATNPRVLGIGFAATRDIVSHLRNSAAGRDLLGRQPTHALGFGISQAGRYLRDHLAQGFNRDEAGARVFDGMFTHVAGIGRVFFNTEFGQPARTRTWHEDHGFPEVEFPFATGALMRGDDSDPKVIETNTSTEYWQKGASLLHTDPDGTHDAALPANVRGYYLPGTQHGGKAGMPRDAGPCTNPRNWHDPMPAIRALLVALDEWVTNGREPPPSRLPRIADGTLARAEAVAWPKLATLVPPRAANDVVAPGDWTDPQPPCARMAGPGAAGRCGRQRDRRYPLARHRRTARHVHRLESVPRPAARRANWPTVTAPIWHLPRHEPNASVPAIRALRWRSAIRRTMPISPACGRSSARCSAIACCSTTMRRPI